jgi:hypothetical protein
MASFDFYRNKVRFTKQYRAADVNLQLSEWEIMLIIFITGIVYSSLSYFLANK